MHKDVANDPVVKMRKRQSRNLTICVVIFWFLFAVTGIVWYYFSSSDAFGNVPILAAMGSCILVFLVAMVLVKVLLQKREELRECEQYAKILIEKKIDNKE